MTTLKIKSELKPVINTLSEIEGDTTIPKNIRKTIQKVIDTLNDNLEIPVRINKALDELEKIADDINIQPYTRTQLWNIISLLEKL